MVSRRSRTPTSWVRPDHAGWKHAHIQPGIGDCDQQPRRDQQQHPCCHQWHQCLWRRAEWDRATGIESAGSSVLTLQGSTAASLEGSPSPIRVRFVSIKAPTRGRRECQFRRRVVGNDQQPLTHQHHDPAGALAGGSGVINSNCRAATNGSGRRYVCDWRVELKYDICRHDHERNQRHDTHTVALTKVAQVSSPFPEATHIAAVRR